jgi:hypothetical protein
MGDLDLERSYGKGDKSQKVRLIQEWLTLQGSHVVVDGDYGPATEAAVKQFQTQATVPTDGVVNRRTFELLVEPMTAALRPISADGRSLGELVVAYAQQHLLQHPREVGGENRGPWVRLYMGGRQGSDWPWCAGFVCFCLKQACQAVHTAMPITASFSCDSLAASARERNRFLRQPSAADRSAVSPGCLFLSRRSSNDWIHTGIVISSASETFDTVEGNTNDEGSPNGFEVCRRVRGYGEKDFVLI